MHLYSILFLRGYLKQSKLLFSALTCEAQIKQPLGQTMSGLYKLFVKLLVYLNLSLRKDWHGPVQEVLLRADTVTCGRIKLFSVCKDLTLVLLNISARTLPHSLSFQMEREQIRRNVTINLNRFKSRWPILEALGHFSSSKCWLLLNEDI